MPRLLITTVGTSLLTNRDDRPWGGWNVRRADPLPEPSVVDRWLREADFVAASAETNTLYRIGLDSDDCVTRVWYDAAMQQGSLIKVLDAAEGRIGIRYESAGRKLSLAVETTARGAAQTELVVEYLRRRG